MTHPLSPPPMGYEYARLLCHKLSRVDEAPAYVVKQDGHLILVDHEQMREGWYAREQIVYIAQADDDEPTPGPDNGDDINAPIDRPRFTRCAGYDKRRSHGNRESLDCWKDADGIPHWVGVGVNPNE